MDEYKHDGFSEIASENKDAIKVIQEKLKENRQAFQMDLNSLRNKLETMSESESLKTESDSNESEIMKKK